MSKSKNKNNIHDALINYYIDASEDLIQEELYEAFPDKQDYDAKKDRLLKKIAFLRKAQEQNQKNEFLLKVAMRFEEELMKNTERPVAMLKQLLGDRQALALNKNLEKLSREEIIEIIRDKNLVELLERLNGE